MDEEKNHIIFLYEDSSTRDKEIVKFINNCLKKNELCVYATVEYEDKPLLKNFCSKISQYQEYVKKKKLMLVDYTPSTLIGSGGYLAQYERIKEEINSKLEKRKKQEVLWIGDFTSWLFQKKNFDECILVEEWAQKNRPDTMTMLCPFPASIMNKTPYKDHLLRLFKCHDRIIDSSGKIASQYTY